MGPEHWEAQFLSPNLKSTFMKWHWPPYESWRITQHLLETLPCEQSAPEKATIRGHGRLRLQVAGQRWALGTGHRNKDCQCPNLNRVLSPLGTPGCVNTILSTRSVIWVMGLVTTMWLRECYISGKGEWPSNKRHHLQEAWEMVPVSPWSPKPGDFSSLNKWSSHEALFISSRHGAQVQSYGQHDHKDDTWTENRRKSCPQAVVVVGEPCPAAVWAWTSNASHRPRRVADNQGWSNFPKTWEALSSISSISKTAKTKSLLLFF